MAMLTEAYIRSSLTRTETRAGHFRDDYPGRDDSCNPYWVILRTEKGEMATHREYLPIETYPVKPYRYYMDQFTWPGQAADKVGSPENREQVAALPRRKTSVFSLHYTLFCL